MCVLGPNDGGVAADADGRAEPGIVRLVTGTEDGLLAPRTAIAGENISLTSPEEPAGICGWSTHDDGVAAHADRPAELGPSRLVAGAKNGLLRPGAARTSKNVSGSSVRVCAGVCRSCPNHSSVAAHADGSAEVGVSRLVACAQDGLLRPGAARTSKNVGCPGVTYRARVCVDGPNDGGVAAEAD